MLSLENKIISLSLIDYYTKNQNVALLAFASILKKKHKKSILDQRGYLEDMKMSLELFLYDLQSVDNLLAENIEYFTQNLEKIKIGMLPTPEQKKQAALIEEHLNTQTVAILALWGVQSREFNGVLDNKCQEDFIAGVELLFDNLEAIYDSMSNNMGLLWEIKDKIATKRLELGVSPIFSFNQQEVTQTYAPPPHNKQADLADIQ